MQQDHIEGVVKKAGALMESFERRCADASARHAATTDRLQSAVEAIHGVVQRSSEQMLGGIASMVTDKVSSGLDAAMDDYKTRMKEGGDQFRDRVNALTEQMGQLERLSRHLMWKLAITVGGALLVIVVGGGAVLWHYGGQMRQHKISAELMRAYNQADVNLCDGRLCANVESRGKKFGDKGQYMVVKPR